MVETNALGPEPARRERCLLLVCDTPEPEVVAEFGDFHSWFGRPLGSSVELAAVDVRLLEETDGLLDGVSSVIVSGSREAAYGSAPWIRLLEQLIREAVFERALPLLGVCFGHQVLAAACGGVVAPNPHGKVLGTVEVQLNERGRRDALFDGVDASFFAQALHTDAVCRLPDAAHVLASNARDACVAFRLGSAWGVQFHPEVEVEMLRSFLHGNAERLRSGGVDPDQLTRELRPTPDGARILQNFTREAKRRG